MSSRLTIVYENIEKIKPYKHNAKIHTEGQIEQIKKSIREFGFNDPIAVDEENIIIEGHGRLMAAKELGIKEVPVIYLYGLTDQQKKAYILAHNKLTMNTGFDMDILADELEQITAFDMLDFGFIDNAESTKMQDLDNGGEVDVDDFAEDKFNCKCPRCGMLFSVEGKGNYSGED